VEVVQDVASLGRYGADEYGRDFGICNLLALRGKAVGVGICGILPLRRLASRVIGDLMSAASAVHSSSMFFSNVVHRGSMVLFIVASMFWFQFVNGWALVS